MSESLGGSVGWSSVSQSINHLIYTRNLKSASGTANQHKILSSTTDFTPSCLFLIFLFAFFMVTRCWSYIGQAQMSGGQPISIGSGCGHIGTVLHEILHSVGFFHTSSRYDRDSYVVVRPPNIVSGKFRAFLGWCYLKLT